MGDFFQLPPVHDKEKQRVEDSEVLELLNNPEISEKEKAKYRDYKSQRRPLFCFEYV